MAGRFPKIKTKTPRIFPRISTKNSWRPSRKKNLGGTLEGFPERISGVLSQQFPRTIAGRILERFPGRKNSGQIPQEGLGGVRENGWSLTIG